MLTEIMFVVKSLLTNMAAIFFYLIMKLVLVEFQRLFGLELLVTPVNLTHERSLVAVDLKFVDDHMVLPLCLIATVRVTALDENFIRMVITPVLIHCSMLHMYTLFQDISFIEFHAVTNDVFSN